MANRGYGKVFFTLTKKVLHRSETGCTHTAFLGSRSKGEEQRTQEKSKGKEPSRSTTEQEQKKGKEEETRAKEEEEEES